MTNQMNCRIKQVKQLLIALLFDTVFLYSNLSYYCMYSFDFRMRVDYLMSTDGVFVRQGRVKVKSFNFSSVRVEAVVVP